MHRDIWSSIAPLTEQMGTMWRTMALHDDPIQQCNTLDTLEYFYHESITYSPSIRTAKFSNATSSSSPAALNVPMQSFLMLRCFAFFACVL